MSGDELAQAKRLFASPCEFVAGATSPDQLPRETLPEIAFVGRSNVGKSSLINALTTRKSLARVSQTPGRTRQINFFRLGERLMLVDLPGYGFARISKAQSEAWQQLILAYLHARTTLRRVILLIDARRGAMDTDKQVMTILDRHAVSYVPVLTKIDTLKPTDLAEAQRNMQSIAEQHAAAFPAIFATSAEKGLGLDDLRLHIAALADR